MASKLIKRIDYYFKQHKDQKRKRIIKLVYVRPSAVRRSNSVQVELRNQALARSIQLVKKEHKNKSISGESPEGYAETKPGDVGESLIDIKSSSIQSDEEVTDFLDRPEGGQSKILSAVVTMGKIAFKNELLRVTEANLTKNEMTVQAPLGRIVMPTQQERERDSLANSPSNKPTSKISLLSKIGANIFKNIG